MSELIPNNPEHQPTSVEAWGPLETGLVVPINGVHLGRIEQPGGGATYKDESHTYVEGAGFIFTVTQSSAGFTGIFVSPSEGTTVSALSIDHETKKPAWVTTSADSAQVIVSGDWGELVKGPETKNLTWDADMKLGEAGIHAGIISVTDPADHTRYFGIAADFEGKEDDWDVTGKIVELAPKNELDSSAPKPLEA